jgi:hypothetical protein
LDVLGNTYFDHHAAMHLSRERLTRPEGKPLPLFLPEAVAEHSMAHMIEAGKEGSGIQFLQMHHEMVRVFRFLLKHHDPPVQFPIAWAQGQWQAEKADMNKSTYLPAVLWDLDHFECLPQEIVGTFNVTAPHYLQDVFKGVRDRVCNSDCGRLKAAIDELGRFIERGVDLKANPDAEVKGQGFHNTLHEYLAAREGLAARGAEMNQLRASMFNDYFWSMHLWIDAQYGRLLERGGEKFNITGLDPDRTDLGTHPGAPAPMTGMSMT